MWKRLRDKAAALVATVVIWGIIIMLGIATSGCQMTGRVDARAFYPDENGGQVWKSRQANPEVAWSWGEAGK